MTREDYFNSFNDHPMHQKLINRLSDEEHGACLLFLKDNETLNNDQFVSKLNRWYLDKPATRPKHYSEMWALLSCAASAERINK